MGMVINGQWSNEDDIIHAGSYIRPNSRYNRDIPDTVIEKISNTPGRYLLIGSNSCQWSHRTMIMRQLKGLDTVLPLHIAHGPRQEGYSVDGGKPWQVPGSDKQIHHLHQLYALSEDTYTGRSTVPVLWDSQEQKIISNESSQITKALAKVKSYDLSVPTYYPEHLNNEMAQLDKWIYTNISNGVYRAGFAESQSAYDEAVEKVFTALDHLEERLKSDRYLLGADQTATDWNLFTTFVRFDLVYFTLHRCMKKRLVDYPNLWAYTRDLYQTEGIAQITDFDVIMKASFQNDTDNNKHNIIPVLPDLNWQAPHNRDGITSTTQPESLRTIRGSS